MLHGGVSPCAWSMPGKEIAMDLMELIRQRRSVRRFQARPVEKAKTQALLEAALRAPSSRSLNPWEFVLVDDPSLLAELAGAKPHGASFLAQAPLGIVVCADPARCDVWVEDCAIAVTFVQLTAQSLGLGSCWIQIRNRDHAQGGSAGEHVARVLGLPVRLEVEAMIAVGYPDETKPAHPAHSLLKDRLHWNRFDQPYPYPQ
jgi:nitroreductase